MRKHVHSNESLERLAAFIFVFFGLIDILESIPVKPYKKSSNFIELEGRKNERLVAKRIESN